MTGDLVRMTLAVSENAALALVVKATVVLGAGLVVVWLLRRSAASVQALVLTATLMAVGILPLAAMIAPPLVVSLPTQTLDVVVPDGQSTPSPSAVAGGSERPFSSQIPASGSRSVGSPASPTRVVSVVLWLAWVLGTAVVLLPVIGTLWRLRGIKRAGLTWLAGERLAERLASAAGVTRRIGVARHEAVHVPMTCGLWRPHLLLPWDADGWDIADVERAVVHEIEHIRRRDWLLILLSRFVCAAYWFHPLVWVAWRRLHLAMERACDDAVLQRGEAGVYAAQLVQLAQRLSTRERHPLPAMATRGDLSARVHALIRTGVSRRRARAVEAVAAAAAAMACLLVIAPLAAVAQPGQAPAQPETGGLSFDVASIRPNTGGPPQGFVRPIRQMPGGRFVANWVALRDLIVFAYGLETYQPVEGDDPLLDARFDVEARAATDVPRAPLGEVGPVNLMVQALLAERFGLAVRWEEREQPVSLLVLAHDDGELGSHLRRSTCPQPGTVEPAPEAQLPSTSSYLPPCGSSATTNGVMQAPGQTMSMFARSLSRMLDRPVLDRTGLDGVFDLVDLSFDEADLPRMRDIRARLRNPEARAAPSPTADKPSLYTALQENLGLKLESARGPIPILIVERVEPPTPN